MPKITTVIEALPRGFDETVGGVRAMGQAIEDSIKLADDAQKMLGKGSKELSEALSGAKKTVEDESKKLVELTQQYYKTCVACDKAGERVDDLKAKWEEMLKAETLPEWDDPKVQELADQIAKAKTEHDRLAAASDNLGKAVDSQRHKVNDARDAIVRYSEEVRRMRDAQERAADTQAMFAARIDAAKARSVTAAQAADKYGISMKGVRDLSLGAAYAQRSLSQLMSGNLVGAFRSGTAAVQSFTKACAMNPIVLAVMAVTAAVLTMKRGWDDARKAAEEYAKIKEDLAKDEEHLQSLMGGGKGRFGGLSDAELEERRKQAEEKAYYADANAQHAIDKSKRAAQREGEMGFWGHTGAAMVGWIPGDWANTPKEERDRLLANEKKAMEGAESAHKELKEIEAEQERRRKAAQSGGRGGGASSGGTSEADRYKREAERVAERRKEFERDREQANVEALANDAGKNGRLAGLEYRRGELRKDFRALNEQLAPMRQMGFALDPEDEKKVLDLEEKLLQINQQISAEKAKQAEEDQRKADAKAKELKAEKENHAEWQRGRKLEGMGAGDRVSFINDEIAKLRQQPATIENRQRMRKLIDERDAAQKDVDALNERKQDFLHRNDTDAQRMASISKQLEEAGVNGDDAAMLELMMAGEDIAENYKKPLTKRQQRRADRKAERDAKAAMRAAKKMRKQIGEIESAWAGGDKSSAEKLADMTIDTNGTVSTRQMSNEGKVVEVKGQDLTNRLLGTIRDLLK